MDSTPIYITRDVGVCNEYAVKVETDYGYEDRNY